MLKSVYSVLACISSSLELNEQYNEAQLELDAYHIEHPVLPERALAPRSQCPGWASGIERAHHVGCVWARFSRTEPYRFQAN